MYELLVRMVIKLLIWPIFGRFLGIKEPEDFLKQGKYPIANAVVSLVPLLGGAGQSFLGQWEKALAIMAAESVVVCVCIVIVPLWLLLPFVYSALKLLCAVDAYMMAVRARRRNQLGRWEFFWN